MRLTKIVTVFALILFSTQNLFAQTPTPAPSKPDSVQPASDPFAFADFGWLNGNSRQTDFPLDSKMFTGEFTYDGNYVYDFAHPQDHTLVGSTNSGRTSEMQVEQLGIGGDFHYQNVRGRLMTQFGMYSTMTPRNDASPSRGQWKTDDAYRYLSEAYGGYHWDTWHGINLDVGIFMSYVGLCSYYNYENWVYQMSYVSANTPWFFNGIRVQTFPSDKLKIEYWFVNGFQTYNMYNSSPGGGFELLWRPTGDWSFVSNNYYGLDAAGLSARTRLHTDNSVQYKYYDNPNRKISKAAFSITLDAGGENGDGVTSGSTDSTKHSQFFTGVMVYNRFWFDHDKFALTMGGGGINNPGRYLVLLPPINGATAATGTPYFTENPGDKFRAWDCSFNFDYMPSQFITYRIEFIHREANVPYFAGSGGITPPGGNNGSPGATIPGWSPDLSKHENRINAALMVRL